MKKTNLQRGYTLLFAVLTAVLVLGVAVFIVGVARKQYILSSTARDSMIALYNADSGVECAIQSQVGSVLPSPAPVSITCNGAGAVVDDPNLATVDQGIEPINVKGFNTLTQSVYQAPGPANPPEYYYLDLPNGCALVKILKGYEEGSDSIYRTVVISRGYNQCSGNGPTQSIKTVERAMQFSVQ